MKVYLKNKETNEILREFDKVIAYSDNSVEYYSCANCRCKLYCDSEIEYFTDKEE